MVLPAKPYLKRVSIRDDAEVDQGKYPYNIPAVRVLDRLEFHPDVTFFVGENGSGKSTVLEAIAVALGYSPEGGTKNFRLQTTPDESVSPLYQALRLARSHRKPQDGFFLRAESFFNVATFSDEMNVAGSYGAESLHSCSHGEAFLALLTHKLRGKGLYLLDEPEAALSPTRQLAALVAIRQLVEDQSQFIIATHSPILLAYPNATIFRFGSDGISAVRFEETEHYTVTRDFMNNYPRRLEQLFGDVGVAGV
jgi:predicted ATPase